MQHPLILQLVGKNGSDSGSGPGGSSRAETNRATKATTVEFPSIVYLPP